MSCWCYRDQAIKMGYTTLLQWWYVYWPWWCISFLVEPITMQYKLHGLPKHIISDCNVLFTSTFWDHLHKLIGTKLCMFSAYHPQSDSSTECANHMVTQMLHQCIHPNQKDWVLWLLAIKFAINSVQSASTGYAPFFLNFGRMPQVMLWSSAPSSKFPAVWEFTMQKKLALLAAHNSILSIHVRQTRDTNHKQQSAPFKKDNLVCLSSKNISFSRGLARKLIPKYIGPYRILRDYGNSSFQLELPAHLKRRGIHDVFHSSLLRVHVPNDNQLFPGCMDTQLSDTPELDDKWAVERILSHVGAGADSSFEIKWGSSDVTWLLYYQITHLDVLTEYFDLLGVSKVSNLPQGKGLPPADDPQIFIGSLSPFHNSPTTSLCYIKTWLLTFIQTITNRACRILNSQVVTSTTTVDIDYSYPMTQLQGVDHPNFIHISSTHYEICSPDYQLPATLHVSQLADIVSFDAMICAREGFTDLSSVPLGFTEVALAWNTGVCTNNPQQISEVFLSTNHQDSMAATSSHPVHLSDFNITLEQCGLDTSPTADPITLSVQADINLEFASMFVWQHQAQQRGYEECREKWLNVFTSGPAIQTHNQCTKHKTKSWSASQMPMTLTSTSASTPASAPVSSAPGILTLPIETKWSHSISETQTNKLTFVQEGRCNELASPLITNPSSLPSSPFLSVPLFFSYKGLA